MKKWILVASVFALTLGYTAIQGERLKKSKEQVANVQKALYLCQKGTEAVKVSAQAEGRLAQLEECEPCECKEVLDEGGVVFGTVRF